jgi:hypothetical protein
MNVATWAELGWSILGSNIDQRNEDIETVTRQVLMQGKMGTIAMPCLILDIDVIN